MVLNQQSADFISTLSKTRVQLIPNFVEATEIEESHIINEKIKTVLYAGGVIETKGCLDLIEVAKAFPEIQFKMVGNPDSAVIKAAKKVSNVVMLGAQKHDVVHEELKKADVFAFLTYFPGEGFSNSLAEAMACGVPCLVTDWSANKDMIENKGGIVVPIRDSQSAIEALKEMHSYELRKAQSEFNLWKIKNEYVDKVVLEQYVDCYEALI